MSVKGMFDIVFDHSDKIVNLIHACFFREAEKIFLDVSLTMYIFVERSKSYSLNSSNISRVCLIFKFLDVPKNQIWIIQLWLIKIRRIFLTLYMLNMEQVYG